MPQGISKIKVGTTLGPDLTVLGVVDEGGEEPVYLVWHHRSWCPMLCKVSRSEKDARREAKALISLAHPNIVRCFGVSKDTYLLMEYLEGPSLDRLTESLPGQRLSISDALRVSIYVGAALCHIHNQGLLHLDVKPANIIMVNGRPILCDFGNARWQTEPPPNEVTGTTCYIAPEACRLEGLSPAADVFGLGVTLYRLLTGRLPFPETRDAEPYSQLSRQPVSVRKYRRSVPIDLERIVLGCLSVDHKVRPKLAELLPDLNRFISGVPLMWPANFHPEL